LKQTVRNMEAELRMWWSLSSEAHRIIRKDPDDPRIVNIREEVTAILLYTDWPLLHAIISRRRAAYEAKLRARNAPLCLVSSA